MAYCGPRGIPLSTFLSWPRADQDAALAWMAYEARRCGRCGTHLDDWKEAEGGSRNAYHAEQYACPGCARLGQAQTALRDSKAPDHFHVRLAAGPGEDCPRCGDPNQLGGGVHRGDEAADLSDRDGHRGASA
jgi:DNA-directed RNA polymerase subunit RPC12/RpoP